MMRREICKLPIFSIGKEWQRRVMITRRGLLLGLGFSAPVAIAATNLMKVQALIPEPTTFVDIEAVPNTVIWSRKQAKFFLHGYMYSGGMVTWSERTCDDIKRALKAHDPHQELANIWNRRINHD